MASTRINFSSAGFRQILNSPETRALIQAEGERIAARAAANTKQRAENQRNDDYTVRVEPGKTRLTCFVWASNVNSSLAETHDRALSKALG